MVRRLSLRPDLPPLDTETNITGSVHVASPTLFKSPTWDTDDDSHKPLRDFKLISRRRSTQDLGFGSGSGFGDEKYSSYLIGSGSSAGMMDGSPMFGILTESQRGRTLSGSSEIGYPVKMVAGPVRLPVSGERDGPTTSASLFLPCATVKDGTCMGRNRRSDSAPPSIGVFGSGSDTASGAGLGDTIVHVSQGTWVDDDGPLCPDLYQDAGVDDTAPA